ncbi:MAG: preprotein translocase subunit SecA [Zetaproteobacteria bacterium CG12_big_fil_rev_8_21_14_0_65_55_1124]|nr:MAG: preprotein translocase subunit SecA [Zetaproteobacteria bacterium CG1_02_55_237]PIS18702.1 MAG: preprotein translocase subunit SecA [Zetaproteobacteria bacterium CG08_land_8_20_14_0_20_55_17]PIW43677.1 MAG: preprotein translocase subunit SecA [Zetaproteobacteria bacterium CG12_big_fil_rev_8_21_14_0_65_55_1124]PIY52654.1 MAG: preprotein translocase subunit SecA [Zetaproteobacteria bacterium CG_4_10_14_0_8_um_filter_55_43]PIZ37838.1 MAG: preprotein translocase subunit SecA [Zetaproteobact
MMCPCGSGQPLADCCGRYLENMSASDAGALMRSRYTAYVLGRHAYLYATWHSSTRPAPGSLGGTDLGWIGLEIIRTSSGGAGDIAGEVEFIASYVDRGKGKRLHETSRFVREDGRWFYVDGDCRVGEIGRNDACPCGSGKKFKRCCAGRK